MINTFGRIAAGIAVAAGLIVGASSPALAASSSGAGRYYVSNDQSCADNGTVTFCSQDHTNSNSVATPSGNYVTTTNSIYKLTITDSSSGYVYYSFSGTYRGTDTNQQNHYAYSQSFTLFGQTCTASQQYHYANGQLQFDRPVDTCV